MHYFHADYLARARNSLGCVCCGGKKTWNINAGGREVLVTDVALYIYIDTHAFMACCKASTALQIPPDKSGANANPSTWAELQNIFVSSHLFAAATARALLCLRRTHMIMISAEDGIVLRRVDTRLAHLRRGAYLRINNAECAASILMCIILECRDNSPLHFAGWAATGTETHSSRANVRVRNWNE